MGKYYKFMILESKAELMDTCNRVQSQNKIFKHEISRFILVCIRSSLTTFQYIVYLIFTFAKQHFFLAKFRQSEILKIEF